MWKEKLKEEGTFLFHDWNVKENNFGVWKLWEEIKANGEYKIIEFTNGYGLGIATHAEKRPEWHDTLEEYKEHLVMKGILLERIHKLDSAKQELITEVKALKDHIGNLEIMNIDKQAQIEESDYRAKELMGEHKKINELLNKYNSKR